MVANPAGAAQGRCDERRFGGSEIRQAGKGTGLSCRHECSDPRPRTRVATDLVAPAREDVGGDARTRTIRILINPRTTNDRLIATIAHELQHALEIIRQPEITNGDQVMELYRRIGTGKCAQGRSDRCETEAALAVEKQVLRELEG